MAEFRRGYLDPEVIKAAQLSQRDYGVPASVTLAQFILESDWGLRNLGALNFFGIKDLKSDPGHVDKRTKEYVHGQWISIVVPFEDFDSIEHCFRIHGKLLATSKYYKAAMAVKENADEFARALTGIYATDPNYGTKLIKVMTQNELYQYDLKPVVPA